jgi:hypothetical protein
MNAYASSPAVYCPHRGMGEKPSPLGEDFSLSMVMKQYTLPLSPPVKGGEILRLPLPLWERAGVRGIMCYLSRLTAEPKAIAFRR